MDLNLQIFERLLIIHLVSLVFVMLEMLPKNSSTIQSYTIMEYFETFDTLQNFLFTTIETKALILVINIVYDLPHELLKVLRLKKS